MDRTAAPELPFKHNCCHAGQAAGLGTGPFNILGSLFVYYLYKTPSLAISHPSIMQGCLLAASDFNRTLKISPSASVGQWRQHSFHCSREHTAYPCFHRNLTTKHMGNYTLTHATMKSCSSPEDGVSVQRAGSQSRERGIRPEGGISTFL